MSCHSQWRIVEPAGPTYKNHLAAEDAMSKTLDVLSTTAADRLTRVES